jgi:hypothetical protein
MPIDSKSHARAVVLAGALSTAPLPLSIFEVQLRVPGIHMVIELHAPPFHVRRLIAQRNPWRRCAHRRVNREP